jgi:hypothetical protein
LYQLWRNQTFLFLLNGTAVKNYIEKGLRVELALLLSIDAGLASPSATGFVPFN